MNQPELTNALASVQAERLKTSIILLGSPPLLLTWKYFGSPEFYLEHLAPRWAMLGDPQIAAAVYNFATCFLLMGLLPAIVVKTVFGERLADYGVQWGNRRTARSFLILLPGVLLVAYLASLDPQVAAHYPMNKQAAASPTMFAFHAASYSMFYLGWEFYFRGFMQMGLHKNLGRLHAVAVQVLASSLLHIGKPASETFAAIAGGLFLGLLAYRTRSLLSGLMLHFLLGVALDWFICYL